MHSTEEIIARAVRVETVTTEALRRANQKAVATPAGAGCLGILGAFHNAIEIEIFRAYDLVEEERERADKIEALLRDAIKQSKQCDPLYAYDAQVQLDSMVNRAPGGQQGEKEKQMHYANGQEAKAGDLVFKAQNAGSQENEMIGILVSATAQSKTCNGRVAPVLMRGRSDCGLTQWLPATNNGEGRYVTISELQPVVTAPLPSPPSPLDPQ